MDKLFGNIKDFLQISKKPVIDNFIFRLHYKFTFAILLAFSILATAKAYIGDPIDCISRDDIPNDLLDLYCWIHPTFSVVEAWQRTVAEQVPYPGVDKHVEGKEKIYHSYYQWVCFVLFLQSLSFYIPRYIWRNIEGHRVLNLVMDFNNPVERAKNNDKATLIVDYLCENIGNHTVYATLYIFVEILNFVNILSQISITDTFLGGEFTTYGTEVLKFTEWDWTLRFDPMIKVFPRMTKCTFHRFGSSGDVQKHDALCVIPVNIVNEKIYVFLWFWFIIVAALTGLGLIYRIVVIFSNRVRYLELRIRCHLVNSKVIRTVVDAVHRDDWLLLTFLSKNIDGSNFKVILEEFADRIRKSSCKID